MDTLTDGGAVKRKKKVYVESSVISYLTARDSRDIIKRARQIATRSWWDNRSSFDLYVSSYVRDEISQGDPEAARSRLEATANLKTLEPTPVVEDVTDELINQGAVPPNSRSDASHIAMSTVHKMDFLVTWNQSHIANADMMGKVLTVIENLGLVPPSIVRPEYFLKETDYAD